MKKDETTTQDEFRPEYDLRALEVRKVDAERNLFGIFVVQLAPDVAEVFPDAESCERGTVPFLIRVTKENSAVPAETGAKV